MDSGYQSTNLFDLDDDKGISMIMINSENGMSLFDESKKYLKYWERTVEEAVNGNPALNHPFDMPPNREDFWKDYKTLPFDKVIEKYMYAEEVPEWFEKRKDIINNQRKDYLKHLPNVLLKYVLGDNVYDKVKRVLKG